MPDGLPLQPGDPVELGGHRLLRRLGEGTQGIVFLGRAPSGEQVAIKLLHARMAGDPGARERFMRELSAAKKVARFCTAHVLDADVAGDHPYIVSEYVDGRPLRSHILAEGPRTGGALERLAIGTLTALAAIHRAGIVHRDFNPHNVLLGSDGPRVIDFGIARALGTTGNDESNGAGTPSYMAPEQITDGEIGPPADMFAWGSTILFAATGRPPFGNEAVHAVMQRIVHDEPDVSALPEPLRSVVAACLAKDPAQRPTAQQAQAGLLGHEATESLMPPPAFGATAAAPPDPAPQGETAQNPAAQNPTAQSPAAPNSAVQNPAAPNLAARSPAAQNPTTHNPAAPNPAARNPAAQNSVAPNSAAPNPAAQNPAAGDPSVQRPAAESPATPGSDGRRTGLQSPATPGSATPPHLVAPPAAQAKPDAQVLAWGPPGAQPTTAQRAAADGDGPQTPTPAPPGPPATAHVPAERPPAGRFPATPPATAPQPTTAPQSATAPRPGTTPAPRPAGAAKPPVAAGPAADRAEPPAPGAGSGSAGSAQPPQAAGGLAAGRTPARSALTPAATAVVKRRQPLGWAVLAGAAVIVAGAAVAIPLWPDGGDAATAPKVRVAAATPAPSTTPAAPVTPRPQLNGVRSGVPKPTHKKTKHPAKGCRDYQRAYTVTRAGSALLKVSVCRGAYTGTALFVDTVPKDGWDICLQLRGHITGGPSTYVSTIVSSHDGRMRAFDNGPKARFGAKTKRTEDAVTVNVGRCRGSGAGVQTSWQTQQRLAAG